MRNIKIGLGFGVLAGVVDVIPMIIQGLSWDADLSAFAFWVIVGLVIATTNIKLKGVLKGIVISLTLMIPLAIVIGVQDPFVLIPILIMNLILGSALGLLIEKYC
ncbi:MAG: hypothetical protein ABIH67_01975 [Candidatus Uhrbacteria bacterium]